ncbi:hypothetical protein SAMN05892883_2231 [Jatrophihabitans sp. GAS493]|uniref:hypothetical protein n=1 Tax=Jatrophihabitans sp. GAS493 TaxID=1907575 RepID=UPI000BB677AE|nr:hypothetical protein [Jatrophihabitans sp. GAS493]SOD72916.1 hypothetical protein SAMN05892883_2231 [Jatrophihabitans sp. GAS493]
MTAPTAQIPESHDYPFIRNVGSPLTADMLRPLDSRCHTVQFKSALTESDYKTLAEWLSQYPSVTLRAYGSYDGSIKDLEFLRYFPTLTKFSADALRYKDFDSLSGLGYLPPTATMIGIGQTKRRVSLAPLARFTNLRRLFVEGQTKDIDVISSLASLRSLTLRSITLPDLSILRPLHDLRALALKLGGTRDLGLLPEIGCLEYLELWMVRGLDDISSIAFLDHLQYLFLQSLKQVTTLPDFSRLTRLETVWMETMKGLTDLTPLLTAPSLRRVAAVDMGHLQPPAVGVLADHPSLQQLRAGLGSKRKNEAVAQLVRLPAGEGWGKPRSLQGEGDD